VKKNKETYKDVTGKICFVPEKYPINYEQLNTTMHRLKAPGGWHILVSGRSSCTGYFYPDPEHSWVLEEGV